MKALLTTAALFAAALFILDVPAATADTWKAKFGVWNGNWSDSGHWVDGSVPTSSDPVVFPTSGSGAYVVTMDGSGVSDPNSGAAQTLDMHADCTVNIPAGKWLEIGSSDTTPYQASSIDGEIDLQTSTSVLRFLYDHCLSGDGYITGSNASAQIEIADGKTLCSQITIRGMLRIVGMAGGSTTRFINDEGGLVDANDAGTLDLAVDALDDGTNCSAGDWQVSSANAAILEFSVGSTKLSGDFTVNVSHADGKLLIQANVATEGDLTFTDGKIEVESGSYFKVKQTGLCS